MNCREFHKGYIVLLDPDSAAPAARAELSEHLKTCRSCAQFYDEIARTVALLRPSTQVNASPQFKESVMNKITQEATAGHAPAPAEGVNTGSDLMSSSHPFLTAPHICSSAANL